MMNEKLYDVIVIGGGPAGLTAALYLARAGCRTLVVEKRGYGGQIAITDEVVNYPGVLTTSGMELTETMRHQAESFGAEFLIAEARELSLFDAEKTVKTSVGDFRCLGVLLATGAQPKMAGFRGEEEFRGCGVSYCATCDGAFFRNKDVFVIGGGFTAAEESVFLTKFARHVTILIRKNDFACPASVADKARTHEKITVLFNTVVQEVSGDDGLRRIQYQNTATGEITDYQSPDGETIGVFVFAGYAPDTALVSGIAEQDARGYIITDENQKTSVEGLYAAGDICVKPLRQVITAASDGAVAAAALEKYCAALRGEACLWISAVVQYPKDGRKFCGYIRRNSASQKRRMKTSGNAPCDFSKKFLPGAQDFPSFSVMISEGRFKQTQGGACFGRSEHHRAVLGAVGNRHFRNRAEIRRLLLFDCQKHPDKPRRRRGKRE